MKYLAVALLASLLALAGSTQAFADGSDGVICAAVHPCNPDGSVATPFNTTDACGLKYAKECLSEKTNEAITTCEDSRSSVEVEAASLKKEINRLKRANRKLKRASK